MDIFSDTSIIVAITKAQDGTGYAPEEMKCLLHCQPDVSRGRLVLVPESLICS